MIGGLDANNSREIILTELIFACSRALSQRGMTGMFLDGVSTGEREIIPLGKLQCWATMTLEFLTDLHCHRFSKVDAVQGCMERDVDYLVATETIYHVLPWSYIVRIDGEGPENSFFCMSLSRRRVTIRWGLLTHIL